MTSTFKNASATIFCLVCLGLFLYVNSPVKRTLDPEPRMQPGEAVLGTEAIVGIVLETGGESSWNRKLETGVQLVVYGAKNDWHQRIASCSTATKIPAGIELPIFVRCNNKWIVVTSSGNKVNVFEVSSKDEPVKLTTIELAENVQTVRADDNLDPSVYDFQNDRIQP